MNTKTYEPPAAYDSQGHILKERYEVRGDTFEIWEEQTDGVPHYRLVQTTPDEVFVFDAHDDIDVAHGDLESVLYDEAMLLVSNSKRSILRAMLKGRDHYLLWDDRQES